MSGRSAGNPDLGTQAAESVHADICVHRRDLEVAIDLEVAPGEVVAVMGPSGAGKSTLVEAVAGLVRLDAGTVRIGADEVSTARGSVPPQRRGTVLLRQDPCLFPHLSARDNIVFGLRARGATRQGARAEADEWLARVGLGEAGGRAPRELSGGQQQRVALARALAASPRVVLLDEPFTALDTETATDLRAMLADQLRAAGTTALLVTHDALDAAAIADRLVLLEDGAITQSGAVRDVLRAPETRFGASIAGLNRVPGEGSTAGRWRSGSLELGVEGARPGRAVVALFRPSDVDLVAPAGGRVPSAGAADPSAPTDAEWTATVTRIDPTVAGVRVRVADPDLVVDIPAAEATHLRVGDDVRLRLRAVDVRWSER